MAIEAPIASTLKQIPSATWGLRGHQLPNQYVYGCSHTSRRMTIVIHSVAPAVAIERASQNRRPSHCPASARNAATIRGIATGCGKSVVSISPLESVILQDRWYWRVRSP